MVQESRKHRRNIDVNMQFHLKWHKHETLHDNYNNNDPVTSKINKHLVTLLRTFNIFDFLRLKSMNCFNKDHKYFIEIIIISFTTIFI